MYELTHYTEEHRLELERLLHSQAWTDTLNSGLVEEVKAQRIEPGKTRNFIDTVVEQLLAFNEQRVGSLVLQGCQDRDRLMCEVSRWPDRLAGKAPKLSFLGLNVTSKCNLEPRCLYCNQPSVQSSMSLDAWKGVIREVTEERDGQGPYIYITGGEPLILGAELYGDDGLVRFATERGAGVNVNTNGVLLSPQVAFRLVKAGLAKLHVSLDTVDREAGNYLRGGHLDKVLEGIYNVQLARDIVGVSYPVIHTNCVLTNRNLDLFPQLFAFLLEKHKQTALREDPLYNDLLPHVIPVGGSANRCLRPSEEEFERFYEEIWSGVCRIWGGYQERVGMPAEKRGALFGYFSNPFLRVQHKGGLDAYVQASAQGRYGSLALAQHCYVAPTQAAFTPDGYQYRCGSHAIRRVLPVGNAAERGIAESIRDGIAGLECLPDQEHCYGCALATLYVNQAVEEKLKQKVEAMLKSKEDIKRSPS